MEVIKSTLPIKLREYKCIDLEELDGNISPAGTWRYSGIYLFRAEFNDNYFILGGDQVGYQILTYKSKSCSRMKVTELLLIFRSLINCDSFIVPALSITTKTMFH